MFKLIVIQRKENKKWIDISAVTGKNVTDIATQINNDNIANITASASDNKLTITYADKIKKLIIADVSGNLFANVIGDQFENSVHVDEQSAGQFGGGLDCRRCKSIHGKMKAEQR